MVQQEITLFKPAPLSVRTKGEFEFDRIYKMLHKWFKANRFKWNEKLYKDKKGGFEGREIEVKLYGDYKSSEFFKRTINISFHVWNYVEKEVLVNGKKKKIGSGKFLAEINGTVVYDYKNKFPNFEEAKGWQGKIEALFGKILFAIRKNEFNIGEAGFMENKCHELANEIKKAAGMSSTI